MLYLNIIFHFMTEAGIFFKLYTISKSQLTQIFVYSLILNNLKFYLCMYYILNF